ncbi:MAG: ATP-dependent RecD-like DNA helicase [Patescibacteria group bacterium]
MPTIEGIVDRITFQNEENSYTVAKLQQEGKGNLATIVGLLPGLSVGETIRVQGDWTTHPEYGPQFQIESFERITPATLNGLERYLGSGLIKGIGPVTAKKIVRAFGLAALDVIKARPERLTQIPGIGPKKAERIARGLSAQKDISDIMVFLQGNGISPAMAAKVYGVYGRGAIEAIRENPYRLAEEIHGIGFKTADRIAARLGVVAASPHRVRAGLVFLMNEFCRDGHVFAPEEEFAARAARELDVPLDLVRETITVLLDQRELYAERDEAGSTLLYPSYFYHSEKGSAARLLALAGQQPPLPPRAESPEVLLAKLASSDGAVLTPGQMQAILAAVRHGVSIITGGPGTGKTTAVRSLLRLYTALGISFLLAAPTGRAAKRLTEATGHEAKTIHRLLEFGFMGGSPCFQRNESRPLEAGALVVDEASMIDLQLFYNLLKAIPPGTRLVLIGDADQLPSVGSGNVLRDLIDARVIPTVRLQVVFRQAEESLIVANAHRINRGELPLLPVGENRDFYFIPCEEPEKVVEQVVELVSTRLPRYLGCDPIEDIQVLTPMHRTVTGVANLNGLLQERLNPPAAGRLELRYGAAVFRERDKVMQIRNDYQKMVFNGDMGRIRLIDREEGQLHVAFPEAGGERLVVYEREDLDELVLSYAISVHKSQGSEYPAVVLPLTTQHFLMLQRNLLYTAVSRAKRLFVLIGTKKALAIAVHNNTVVERNTRLAERLRQG